MTIPFRPALATSRHALALALVWTVPLAAAPVSAPSDILQPAPATGSEPPVAEDDVAIDPEEGEIVVTGTFQRGGVLGDIQAEVQLDAADISAFGAGSLADLLQELGPQLRSGRGRGGEPPVVLVNGRRVSGFAEIRNLPPEALERVDILPEEVALKYGFRADQRVINFVLRERFNAVTVELEPGFATDGGRSTLEAEGNLLRLSNGTRLSFEAEYERENPLLEAERLITTPPQGQPFSYAGGLAGQGGATAAAFGEIDPALSALLGTPTGLVGVPGVAATRAQVLADFGGAIANAADTTDLTPFRTLLPQTERLSLGATYNRNIGSVSATISGRFESNNSEARLGLPGVSLALPAANPFNPFANPVSLFRYGEGTGPLLRQTENLTGRVGVALNGDVGAWRWSLNVNYDRAETDTLTDRGLDTAALQARLDAGDPAFNPFSAGAIAGTLRQDRARATTDLGEAELVATGSPLLLPAGAVSTTFKAGFETRRQGSISDRGGLVQEVDLSRNQGRFQTSVDVPLTSTRNDVLAGIGDFSLNFNASLDQLSDLGSLVTYGYGLNWAPTSRLRLLVSVSEEEAAPSIQQLGNPLIVTPNVRVFDLVNGETVDITRLDGGNAGLSSDSRRVIKVGGNWKPFAASELSLSVNFIDSRLRGQVSGFPTATPEIEAAFPERFVRDDNGRLIQIDNRPINFAGADRQEIRTGLSLFQALKPSKAEQAAAEARRAQFAARRPAGAAAEGRPGGAGGGTGGGAGGRPGGGGGRGFGGPGGGGGRVFVSLFHTLHTINRISIREGVPDLDLLGGSATGARGGQPRHEVEFRVGANKAGFGGRLSLDWRAGTTVRTDPSSPVQADGDLRFGGLATMGLRLFADLGQQRTLVEAVPFLRGSRLSLNVDNLANARLQVRNRLGEVPIGYQPDQLDPLGRTIGVQFRKVFFARPPGGGTAGAPPA
ncbi:hypothetical protein GCM10007973_11630 [Polymorphobacter multimanifer]|uniref:TonB-dependent receptor n=1 Tax=Polymorphobacter multimanifer TaxID=1070431 RepID=A0A841L4D1_9SPHN|nr:TonB-dependent receptor plug domain-containing protein [Polymorphobacter multimanifer]MBB6227280.1 hypothetical protein [Polymorphobacter multimanifer]GGI76438.1 hypothetical protein GCM10007973_11630 [Polymorphobacter multimanifer]